MQKIWLKQDKQGGKESYLKIAIVSFIDYRSHANKTQCTTPRVKVYAMHEWHDQKVLNSNEKIFSYNQHHFYFEGDLVIKMKGPTDFAFGLCFVQTSDLHVQNRSILHTMFLLKKLETIKGNILLQQGQEYDNYT